MEIPVFTGDELRPWIAWMENRHSLEEFDELQKLALAYGFIEGEALSWLNRRQSWLPFHRWESLKNCLWLRFGKNDDPEKIEILEAEQRWKKLRSCTKILEEKTVQEKELSKGKESSEEIQLIPRITSNPKFDLIDENTEATQEQIQEEEIETQEAIQEEERKEKTQLTKTDLMQGKDVTYWIPDHGSPKVSIYALESSNRFWNESKDVLEESPFAIEMSNGSQFHIGLEDVDSKKNAYNVLDRMHIGLYQLKKISLAPKSWMFKFKQRNREEIIARNVTSARKVFEEIPERNVIIINVMIRSYVNNGFYREGIQVFKTMYGCHVRPDHYTFPCVLKACSCSGNVVIGKKIHGSAMRVGLSSTLFVGNGLVSMYGKCEFLTEARLVLDEMSRRDVVSWNSLVAGYAQNQRFDDALEVCREMESVKISHDAGTMASLLPAVSNTTRENVMYVEDRFLKMGKKSLVSWNVMIGVYMKNAMPVEAVGLYSRMEADGIEPDAVSITSVLPACGDTSALSLGKKIHGYIERKKLIPNLLLENALIDMDAKCGCLDRARDVFENMKSRDVVSWTAMISAYGVSGRGRDAVALFSKMQDSGLVPDSIAFVTTLAACSHAGLLKEGQSYFKLMTDHYNITPRLEHLACMVDILGRTGKVREAYSFIQEMQMEPNERVWGALLGAKYHRVQSKEKQRKCSKNWRFKYKDIIRSRCVVSWQEEKRLKMSFVKMSKGSVCYHTA